MPESKCGNCGAIKWKQTREAVMEWELKHHQSSFKKAPEGSLAYAMGYDGFHDCRVFQEYSDETGRPTQIRIYNYNRLVETEDC